MNAPTVPAKRRARRKPKSIEQVIAQLPVDTPLKGIAVPVDLKVLNRNWSSDTTAFEKAIKARRSPPPTTRHTFCLTHRLVHQARHYIDASPNPSLLLATSRTHLTNTSSLLQWTKWALTIVHNNPLHLVSLLTHTLVERTHEHRPNHQQTPKRSFKRKRSIDHPARIRTQSTSAKKQATNQPSQTS